MITISHPPRKITRRLPLWSSYQSPCIFAIAVEGGLCGSAVWSSVVLYLVSSWINATFIDSLVKVGLFVLWCLYNYGQGFFLLCLVVYCKHDSVKFVSCALHKVVLIWVIRRSTYATLLVKVLQITAGIVCRLQVENMIINDLPDYNNWKLTC